MQVRDIMTIYPVYIRIGADMRRAAEIISISEVSDLKEYSTIQTRR